MKIKIHWCFDLPEDCDIGAHDRYAKANGVPIIVDMCDHLPSPESATEHQIAAVLFDKFNRLIHDWEVI
ncbi:MAG: hypothetical protein CMB80_10705 [Flammeovirgaceae bacterium]|nr:hypothetical protein [Flammeovirgaceae bacterium]|tara:strand:- start:1267 stop:1473 length:207 start_codon:yes stop_codon:yes gene_type:complete